MMIVPESYDGQTFNILIAEAEAMAAGESSLLVTRDHLVALCQLVASLRQALQQHEAVIAELLVASRAETR